MTAKPILYVANVDETDLAGEGPLVQQVREFAAKVGAAVVPVCAKLEAEIAELDEADRAEMLAVVGLTEPALRRAGPRGVPHARPAELLHGRREGSPGLDRSRSAPPPRRRPA